MARADAEAKRSGINADTIYRGLLSKHPSGACKLLQRELAARVLATPALKAACQERLRHKVKRWRVHIPLGLLCRRLLRRLLSLQRLISPRAQSAVFKTLWNGWTTAARFQEVKPCVLGCSPSAEDRIEHYACCSFTSALVVDWMGLDRRLVNLGGF